MSLIDESVSHVKRPSTGCAMCALETRHPGNGCCVFHPSHATLNDSDPDEHRWSLRAELVGVASHEPPVPSTAIQRALAARWPNDLVPKYTSFQRHMQSCIAGGIRT